MQAKYQAGFRAAQLGEPSPDVLAALDTLADVNRLEELTVR